MSIMMTTMVEDIHQIHHCHGHGDAMITTHSSSFRFLQQHFPFRWWSSPTGILVLWRTKRCRRRRRRRPIAQHHHRIIGGNILGFLMSTTMTMMTIFLTTASTLTSAWSTEWINLESAATATTSATSMFGKISPPRSGHVAFGLNDKVFVFGGYAEEIEMKESTSSSTTTEAINSPIRYPTNDVWVLDPLHAEQGWQPVDCGGGDSAPQPPQQRLAAAAVTCRSGNNNNHDEMMGLVLGGWDSQEAGTGGVILQDLQSFTTTATTTTATVGVWKPLSFDLQQPTSRLCAVTPNTQQVLVHNHRCTDHVLIVDLASSQLKTQPTSGIAPSPRGLHVCAVLPGTHKVVLFGGAAQDGNMSNEVFVLDTDTWEWQQPALVEAADAAAADCPSPRASPCMVAIDASTCILYGGASRSSEQGLHGCSDTWMLQLLQDDDDTNKPYRCIWTKLNDDGAVEAPPGRNAATLTPLSCKPNVLLGSDTNEGDDDDDDDDDDDENSQYFLLSGGWYPFRTTYNDNFVLKVTKSY